MPLGEKLPTDYARHQILVTEAPSRYERHNHFFLSQSRVAAI